MSREGRRKNPHGIRVLANRPDYAERFDGLDLGFSKSVSEYLLVVGTLSLQDWRREVGPAGIQNPTLDATRSAEDGSLQSVRGPGGKEDVFFGSARWLANVHASLQLPWRFRLDTRLFAREGYVAPLFSNHNFLSYYDFEFVRDVSIAPLESVRMDDIWKVDLGLTKSISAGRTRIELGMTVFNLFNDDAVLQMERQVAVPGGAGDNPFFGRTREILAPRIVRFSGSIHF